MKNIIFIAPPAAGKGTQSKLVSAEYNIPHISTGDLLRDEINSGSELGNKIIDDMNSGLLVSNDIIVRLLRNRISEVDCNNGYILDGFPRNVEQAKIYQDLLNELRIDLGLVIYMDISKELSMSRSLSRVICSSCGASYNSNIPELRPKLDGICDKCGHALKVREDDNQETINTRYDTYLAETQPLIEYYTEQGILKDVKIEENDNTQDIFAKIKAIIDNS
ncbi:MAG: nucleoside monophosphate kinase [Bacilli bacterium]|nr:nucleoside monophosphate kinase [Bacilli bacterium]